MPCRRQKKWTASRTNTTSSSQPSPVPATENFQIVEGESKCLIVRQVCALRFVHMQKQIIDFRTFLWYIGKTVPLVAFSVPKKHHESTDHPKRGKRELQR